MGDALVYWYFVLDRGGGRKGREGKETKGKGQTDFTFFTLNRPVALVYI